MSALTLKLPNESTPLARAFNEKHTVLMFNMVYLVSQFKERCWGERIVIGHKMRTGFVRPQPGLTFGAIDLPIGQIIEDGESYLSINAEDDRLVDITKPLAHDKTHKGFLSELQKMDDPLPLEDNPQETYSAFNRVTAMTMDDQGIWAKYQMAKAKLGLHMKNYPYSWYMSRYLQKSYYWKEKDLELDRLRRYYIKS